MVPSNRLTIQAADAPVHQSYGNPIRVIRDRLQNIRMAQCFGDPAHLQAVFSLADTDRRIDGQDQLDPDSDAWLRNRRGPNHPDQKNAKHKSHTRHPKLCKGDHAPNGLFSGTAITRLPS